MLEKRGISVSRVSEPQGLPERCHPTFHEILSLRYACPALLFSTTEDVHVRPNIS